MFDRFYFVKFVNDESAHQLEAQGEGKRRQPLEREVTCRGGIVAVNLNDMSI